MSHSGRNSSLQHYVYQLCSNVINTDSRDAVLGHDFILYLRQPPEAVRLDVFFLRTVNATPPWDELVASRTVPVNGSGWQAFHLKSVADPITESSVCVEMYVRETNNINERRLLNRSELAERFVLDDCSPSEIANQPFVATFMLHYGTITLPPLFGRRSVRSLDLTSCSYSNQCSLQSHRVDPTDYLSSDILYPQEVDLGACANGPKSAANDRSRPKSATVDRERGGEIGSAEHSLLKTQYQCVPTQYTSLLLLVAIDSELALELIPDLVIAGCTLQPCRQVQ